MSGRCVKVNWIVDNKLRVNVCNDQIERMKHFDFDEWRQRYMRWMNDNKSRVMDFFRKQDRDHDGKVTRQEFIDGILQSSMLERLPSLPISLL